MGATDAIRALQHHAIPSLDLRIDLHDNEGRQLDDRQSAYTGSQSDIRDRNRAKAGF